MRGLARSGRAVVFVSHELDVIPELCDRALLLSHGRVAMEGDPAAVVARHRADATAGEA
jgi:ABC-type polysaccharide/polyol phosphate transport system ATPase subunit